jgi:hypothetical protein
MLEFNNLTDANKARLIKIFINEKCNDNNFKEEIEIAHNYLEKLNAANI